MTHTLAQYVTGFRTAGERYVMMRIPIGTLPIFVRYEQHTLDTNLSPLSNEYQEGNYGDGWTISTGGNTNPDDPFYPEGDPNTPPTDPPSPGYVWMWDDFMGWVEVPEDFIAEEP